MSNATNAYQEALLESEKVFLLELGTRRADAVLVIRNGALQVEAPGVETRLTRNTLEEMREIIDFALRMGYGE